MAKRLHLPFIGLSLLALAGGCNAAREDGRGTSKASRTPATHDAVVQCVLYDGMTKESPQLAVIEPGTKVQVLDSVNVYFVKARVSKGDKVVVGYMYRTCFPQEW